MCGIVGIWGGDGGRIKQIRQATNLLRHRGPDGEGYFRGDTGVIGHRRLCIVDIDGSWQPLKNEDGRVSVVYNGEIYNHRALKSSVGERHSFRTAGDGEIIAHLLEESSMREVAKALRGMFAIAAVHDTELSLARDPLGIKPLYWSRVDGKIAFASEIKALLPIVPASSIEEFPAGHVFTTTDGLERYWDLPVDSATAPIVGKSSDDALFEAMERAVEMRLMSDVPVGVFLSGGLDSSLIAAIAKRMNPSLKTFAIGTAESPDIAAAREVAAYIGSEHHEILLRREQVAHDLPLILHALESFDVDLVASAIPTYYLSKYASKRVKVVLTGEGADEIFAGYDYLESYCGKPQVLDDELRRLMRLMSSVNLQRVNRMTMAHGLEARVPFLDLDVVRLALALPLHDKMSDGVQKVALRRIATRLLPQAIAYRPKAVFADGSGMHAMLRETFDAAPADIESALKDVFHATMSPEIDHLIAHWRNERTSDPSLN